MIIFFHIFLYYYSVYFTMSTTYHNDDFQKTRRFTDSVTVSAHLSVLVHASYQILNYSIITLFLRLFGDMSQLCHCIIATIIAPSSVRNFIFWSFPIFWQNCVSRIGNEKSGTTMKKSFPKSLAIPIGNQNFAHWVQIFLIEPWSYSMFWYKNAAIL